MSLTQITKFTLASGTAEANINDQSVFTLSATSLSSNSSIFGITLSAVNVYGDNLNIEEWDSTYNTVTTLSTGWGVDEYIGGDNTISIIGGEVTVDALSGRSQKLSLTTDITAFNAPINLDDGQTLLIIGTQDFTTQYGITLATNTFTLMGGAESDVASVALSGKFAYAITRDVSDYLIWISTPQ